MRRPGAAALDLCYVAAGYYDGFFETGLSAWDVAAGSLIITEAGGLVGNFTGEADYLYQREVVAGNPKVYAQLVAILAPHTGINEAQPPSQAAAADPMPVATPESALAKAVGAEAAAAEPSMPAAARERDSDLH